MYSDLPLRHDNPRTLREHPRWGDWFISDSRTPRAEITTVRRNWTPQKPATVEYASAPVLGAMPHETQRILEKDGFRALVSVDAGQVTPRPRRGTEMLPAFPEDCGQGRAAAGRDRAGRCAGRMGRRGAPCVRAVAGPACPAWCRGGPGGTGVASSLCGVRSAAAVREDLLTVPAAQGRHGIGVCRPPAHRAVGAVSVDHRCRRRARVVDVGVGRDGGRGLQKAGQLLQTVGEGVGEIQGLRNERGDRRRGHQLPGSSLTAP